MSRDHILGDIRSPRWLFIKGVLFLVLGLLAGTILLLDSPTLRTTVLLAITIWAFCRAYYFAFYVIEHYVDPGYRFAGIWDFARYCRRRPWQRNASKPVAKSQSH